MNLKNFEEFFDDVILKRGLDYYKSGYVESLELDDDTWIAEVSGSDDYEVTVTLSDNGDIVDTTCDCPYDWGDYCKHQAAVLYALRNHKNTASRPKKAAKKPKLEDVLGKLDKQTLLSIVLEFAGRDRGVKEELLMRYSDKTDAVSYAKGVIKSSIKSVTRRGFVEYGDTGRATDGAYTVLEMADDLLAAKDVVTSISLCTVVLDEMMDLLDMCDDSDGDVGGAISEAIEYIKKSTSDISLQDKDVEKLFDIIYKHAMKSMYNGWTDWRIQILAACVTLCKSSVNRSKLEAYLADQASVRSSEWGHNYELGAKQKLQYEIIRKFDGDAATESFIEQHMENSDFRRIAIQNAIAGKQYEKALKLCLDGEKKDQSYAGLVSKWKNFRYVIYEKAKDAEAQKILAEELLLNGDFDYFIKLKALYKNDEWQPVLQEILEILGDKDHRGVYVKILIHEKLKIRLLDYCKQNIYYITELYPHLLPECKTDVGTIFLKYIRHQAAGASDRGMYRKVCDLIRHYKKACGSVALEIRDELTIQYPKRPAFLDELGKVK